MSATFSFWELEHYDFDNSILIIGGGIVGLSTAISLKEISPQSSIIVLDRQFPPSGASTKNAGFVCFGSYSEIMDDLDSMTETEVINLIKMRWEGIQLLRSRLKPTSINNCGGVELFRQNECPEKDKVDFVNNIFYQAIGIPNYLRLSLNDMSPNLDSNMVEMPAEGALNPMDMMTQLYQQALSLGVKFVHGLHLRNIDQVNRSITLNDGCCVHFNKLLLCTNGFTKEWMEDLPLQTVRNQVIMSKPLKHGLADRVYHFDKGYYYFRPVGDRILIGGARNLDFNTETTSQFGENRLILEALVSFAKEFLPIKAGEFEIEDNWSGILGVGKSKEPIIRSIDNNISMGVRLGGMGVAIGSFVGQKLAEHTLKNG